MKIVTGTAPIFGMVPSSKSEKRIPMSDESDLLAANAAFYLAFHEGDVEAMARLWADDGVSCIHPGWSPLIGRAGVMKSWDGILGNPNRPRILCRNPVALLAGDDGRVLCLEFLGDGVLAATNQFRRIGGLWRMLHHHASPVADILKEAPGDPPSRQLH
jgi:hypothetical protein